MTPREQFASLLVDLGSSKAAEYEMMREGSKDDEAYKRRIYMAAKDAGYRGKEPVWEASSLSEPVKAACEKVKATFLAEWQPRYDALRAQTKAIEEQLGKLSYDVEIAHADTWKLLRREGPDYQQGDAYARGSVEIDRVKCERSGVRAEVVRVPRLDDKGREKVGKPASYECRVYVAEDLDIELLKRRAIPLRDIVRLLWKNGCNPRFFMPFLPHEFEEKAGIDYFGNDLRTPEREKIAQHDKDEVVIGKAAWEVWHYHKGPTWHGDTKSWRFELSASEHPIYGRIYPAHAIFVQRIESNLFERRIVVLGTPMLVSHPERVEWSWDDTPEQRFNSLFGERSEVPCEA